MDIVELATLADLERRRSIARRGHVSSFTYSKLVLANDLATYDEVVYLDVDTLIRGSIAGLLDWPLRFEIAAVPEFGSNGMHLFGTARTPYFNAGVLKMSLSRMRESDLLGRAMRLLDRHPRLPFQEQDVMNVLHRDAFDVLPPTYNVFDLNALRTPPYFQVFHDPTVVHFVGPTKPWHRESDSANAREWREVNATAISMRSDLVDHYVNGERRVPRHRVADAIASVRLSPVGSRVRAALPYGVKNAVNQAVLHAVPERSRLSAEILAGIVARTAPAETSSDGRPSPTAPVHEPATDGVAADRRTPPPQSGRGELVLVMSAARSGTNALGSLLSTGFPEAAWLGEFYGGFTPPAFRLRATESFPWLADNTAPDFARRMQDNAVEVTRSLVQSLDGPAIIKVFPDHLGSPALDAVLDEFSPRLVVLRRTLLFSLLSLLRSRATGVWFRTELTDIAAPLTDDLVSHYVTIMDTWFDTVAECGRSRGLPALSMTYSDIHETRVGLSALREFFSDWPLSPAAGDDDSWLPRTAIQDRRTDESIERVVAQFTRLSAPNRAALLRLPGAARAEEAVHPTTETAG